MNDNFKVAILQLKASQNQEDAMYKGIESCKKAKKMGADIAVFPEAWNTGYEMLFKGDLKDQNNITIEKIKNWESKAIENDNEFILNFKSLAKELQMAILLTYLEKTEDKPKNTAIIIDRNGEIILKYSKVHTVDCKMEAYMQSGDEFSTHELDYGRGKIQLGVMICFDRDFPESARILMLQGAEIILVQLKVRAYENMVGIICVNYSNHGGKSSAFSPIVRNNNKQEVNSEILIMNSDEKIEVVEFDMKKIRSYRSQEAFGDAYRKPYAYQQLVEDFVKDPFIRTDSRRKNNKMNITE